MEAEGEEYVLERILAEKTENGSTTYLVKWQGYPWYDWSWEPEESFNDDGTIEQWRFRQIREVAGERKAFDYKDFDRRWTAHWNGEETHPPETPEPESDPEPDTLMDDVTDDFQGADQQSPALATGELATDQIAVHGPHTSAAAPEQLIGVDRRQSAGEQRSPSTTSKALPAEQVPSLPEALSGGNNPLNSSKTPRAELPRKGHLVRTKSGTNVEPKPLVHPRLRIQKARKSSQTLGGPALSDSLSKRANSSKGIFDNWQREPKRRPSLLEPSKIVKPYRNMATMRSAEIRGRIERAPDLNSLTLFSPRDGAIVRPSIPIKLPQELPLPIPPPGLARRACIPDMPANANCMDSDLVMRQSTPAQNSPARPKSVDQVATTNASSDTPPHSIPLDGAQIVQIESSSHSTGNEQNISQGPASHNLQLRTINRADTPSLNEDNLFLTQSPPREIVTEPTNIDAGDLSKRSENDDTQRKEVGPNHEANDGKQDGGLRRSLSNTNSNSRSPSKRRLFGDAVQAKVRRMSVPEVSSEIQTRLPFPRVDILATHFMDMTGNDAYSQYDGRPRVLVYGSLVMRRNKEIVAGVMFKDLPRHLKPLLLAAKVRPDHLPIWISKTCTAADYFDHHHCQGEGYFGGGNIQCFKRTWPELLQISQALRERREGGLYFGKRFTMLVYPPGTDEWNFMDARFVNTDENETLRFVMRTPVTTSDVPDTKPDASLKTSALSCPTSPFEKIHSEVIDKPTTHPLFAEMDSEQSKEQLRAWVEGMFPPPTKANDPVKFFLFFPETCRKEHDMMVDLLRSCAGVRSYGCFEDGEWDFFRNKIKRGVVLVHRAIKNYNEIKGLAKSLRGGTRFYSVDLAYKSGRPLDELSKPLFRSGCALVILDSTLLQKPKSVWRIMQWYCRCIIPTKDPKTWKLLLRPQFKGWLREQIMNPANQANREPLWGLLEEYLKIVPSSMEEPEDERETPYEQSPLITPSTINGYDHGVSFDPVEAEKVQHNDELLVRWFGRWSLNQVYRHRRLYIVCSGDKAPEKQTKQWAEDWQHVSVVTIEEFAKAELVEDNLASYHHKRGQKKPSSTTEDQNSNPTK